MSLKTARLNSHAQSRHRWRALERVRVRPLVGESAADESSAGDDYAQRCGIGAASFRECLLHGARAPQQPREAVIPLVTPRLVVNLIFRVALLFQLLLDGPRSG